MFKKYSFGSRYIVDVSIDEEYITLTDSGRGTWYIDPKDSEVMNQFKYWLENIFLKGVQNFLLVLKYEIIHDKENIQSNKIIKKFVNINLKGDTISNVNQVNN